MKVRLPILQAERAVHRQKPSPGQTANAAHTKFTANSCSAPDSMDNETFRRFAKQIQSSGGLPGGNPRNLFAGGGLVAVLVAGGILLNASLFNGTSSVAPNVSQSS